MRLTKRKPKVVMHLDGGSDGVTIDGILLYRASGHYVLGAASLVVDADTSRPLGETKVPCSRVLFYQVIA